MNIRYASGTRNMAIWTMHAPGRYAFVATEGPIVLFEFGASKHLAAGAKLVDETRLSTPWFYFLRGSAHRLKAAIWAPKWPASSGFMAAATAASPSTAASLGAQPSWSAPA